MDWITFTIIWGIGLAFILTAPALLFAHKRPEYGLNVLKTRTVGYWWFNLNILVKRQWVRPIRQAALFGVLILLLDVFLLVVSQTMDFNISVWVSYLLGLFF